MKVYIPNDSSNFGGGWTFRNNFIKAPKEFTITEDLTEADICLIPGATMISEATYNDIHRAKCKIVLRVDGVPELWRNHRHTWGRFKSAFSMADGIVYQSIFVAETTGNWLNKENKPWTIIMNGVDTSVFKDYKRKREGVLNINSRKDANKRIEEVIHWYRKRKIEEDLKITFAGKYPTYLVENDFGLYDYQKGKDWIYTGQVGVEQLVSLMNDHKEFWFPSFADPCPNVLIEALHCGIEPKYINPIGGAMEILIAFSKRYDFSLRHMASQYNEFFETINKKKCLTYPN